ncbi:MAG: glycosyltransferase family 4 protein [Thermoplasmata archaeon]
MKIIYTVESKIIHNYRFINKFIEKGYEVYIINFGYDKYDDIPGATVINKTRRFANIPWIRGIIWKLFYFLDIWFLKKQIDTIKPDVLHGGWVLRDGYFCAATGFHPFILMPWGSDILIHPNRSRIAKRKVKYAIAKADMITCDAEYVKKRIMELQPFDPDKIIVFPWGIDLKKFNPNYDRRAIRDRLGISDEKIVLITRSLEPIYGLEYLLTAIPKVLERHPNTRFVFCGGGSLQNVCNEFINNNNLSGKVFLMGAVKNEELPLFLCTADVWASPSLSDGTPVSLLEAMACGLPVIVTDNTPVLEWVTDGVNGLVIQKKDPHAIFESVCKLLDDEELRKKFGEENLKIAKERADWEKNFAKLEEMYQKLLAT